MNFSTISKQCAIVEFGVELNGDTLCLTSQIEHDRLAGLDQSWIGRYLNESGVHIRHYVNTARLGQTYVVDQGRHCVVVDVGECFGQRYSGVDQISEVANIRALERDCYIHWFVQCDHLNCARDRRSMSHNPWTQKRKIVI